MCSIWKKKTMTVSDNTIATKVLVRFCKKLGWSSAKAGKKSNNYDESPGRASQIRAKVGTAAVSKLLNQSYPLA